MSRSSSSSNQEARRAVVSHAYESRRLEILASEVTGRRILDIGYARQPSPYLVGDEVVGLDLDEVPRSVAPNYTERIVGDATQLDAALGRRQFDTIICGELIEHIEEPYAFMRQLHAALAPGGTLVLSTPNPLGFPIVLAEVLRSTRFFYSRDHLYLFTPRWVQRLVSQSGFDLRATKAVGMWLPRGYLPWCPVWLSYIVVYVATPNRVSST